MTEEIKPRIYEAEHYKDMDDAALKQLLEQRYQHITTLEDRLSQMRRRHWFVTGALTFADWIAGTLASQHFAGRKADTKNPELDDFKNNLTRIRMPACEKDAQGRPIPKYADQPFKCAMSNECCLSWRLISDGQLEKLAGLVKHGGKDSSAHSKRTLSFAAATSSAGAFLGLSAGRYISSQMTRGLRHELHALKHESIVAENELYHRGHQR